jgi:hypothetical protein
LKVGIVYTSLGVDVHPKAVERDADDVESVIPEDLEGEEVGGILDENGVAGAGESMADEVERLRGAGGEEQRVGARRMPARARQEVRERRAKTRIARLLAIVELDRLRIRQEALARGAQAPQRQQVGGRLPDAKVDRAKFRRAVECDARAHGATSAADTRRNTSPGRPCRYAAIFCAEIRRRSASAASE